MTILAGMALVIAVAALIALPLTRTSQPAQALERNRDAVEALEHEKDVALLAIKEAEFDRAMGKLSDDDYSTLRNQYEERALNALSALDTLPPPDSGTIGTIAGPGTAGFGTDAGAKGLARFCAACGQYFEPADHFCSRCGSQRRNLPA